MSRRRQRLTSALAAQIAAGVRSGSFPHVAAQAFGLTAARFEDWLKRGTTEQAREPYRSFAAAVEQAAAQARLRAEMTVLEEQPRAWLQYGPGRDGAAGLGGAAGAAPAASGWTSAARPLVREQSEPSALTHPVVSQVCAALAAEESIPTEMRDTVAAVLDRLAKRAVAALEPAARRAA